MARLARLLGLTLLFGILSYFYLLPASLYLLQGRRDIMLGDGSDMAALPFQYGILVETLRTHWTRLFYGAVHTFQLNPPDGFLLWFTWIEKILVSGLAPFFPVEQMPTVIACILFVLNGLSFYWFGRTLQWPRIISLSLGIAWAFNAFTRARVSVHLAMAGTFFLPLTFVGLHLLAEIPSSRRRALATLCFVGAVLGQQYFTLCLVVLSPFLVIYGMTVGKGWLRRIQLPDVLVVLAPVSFLVWNLAMPAPAQLLTPGTAVAPPPFAVELFMNVYAAKPIDYLGFDMKHGTADWNPIRERINESILADIGQSNEHERSHGIRWSLLLLAAWAAVASFRKRRSAKIELDTTDRRLIGLFLGIAVFSFWTSLAPDSLELFGIRWSPFLLINQAFRQFRVPSRFSICVEFSVIAICGIYLRRVHDFINRKKAPIKSKWQVAWMLLPLVMVFDYPPLLPIRTYPVLAPLTVEETTGSGCGTGMYFPYFSGISMEITTFYHGLQILRGTDCRVINLPGSDDRNSTLLGAFSPPVYQHAVKDPVGSAKMSETLENYARCSSLDWIYFRLDVLDSSWISTVCKNLGWKRVSHRFCRRVDAINGFQWNSSCLASLRRQGPR